MKGLSLCAFGSWKSSLKDRKDVFVCPLFKFSRAQTVDVQIAVEVALPALSAVVDSRNSDGLVGSWHS